MTGALTLCLAVWLACGAQSVSTPFNVSVPFNASLVGRTYSRRSPCVTRFSSDRFVTAASVRTTADELVFSPASCPACDADAPFPTCYEQIVLRFTRRDRHPHVVRYVKTTLNASQIAAGATCASAQPVKIGWPWGSSRPVFVSAVRDIAQGALAISRFQCPQNRAPYSANADAGGFVYYLTALAWDFYFTAL